MGEAGEYEINDSKRTLTEPLRVKGSTKGSLIFTCSFFPTLNVMDPDDEEKETTRASGDVLSKSLTSSRESLDVPKVANAVRNGAVGTITPLKVDGTNAENDLKKQLSANEKEQSEANELLGPAKVEAPKIRIGVDDLAQYVSGLLVFNILEGDMAHTGCHLEVVMDDMLFPSYSTSKIRSRQTSFNEVGDAMIRELDMSRIILRLVEGVDKKGEGNDEHIKAKLVGPTLTTLKQCLYTPSQLTLRDREGRESKITVSLKFLPVKMTLDPSESMNNQGNLRVEVLSAANLPAADRNGYSDPYCRFNLDGKEVYKTKTQKKTLDPAWNEFFEVPVRSRTAAHFEVNVYDWDFGEKADFLGKAAINLDKLEAFRKQEVELRLDGKSGVVRLKMLFKPDYVMRSRQGSSTFSGTFNTPGKVIGAPVKGMGKGAVLVGGGVVKGAGFLGRGFRRRKSRGEGVEDGAVSNGLPAEDLPEETGAIDGVTSPTEKALPSTPHQRSRSFGTTTSVPQSPGTEPGTATISVLSASGFPEHAKVEVRVLHDGPRGLKEVLKTKAIKNRTGEVSWEEGTETRRVVCAPDAGFRLAVRDHSTFGTGSDLGEAAFLVNDQGAGGEQEVRVGGGAVVVRSAFEPAAGDAPGGLAAAASRESPAAGKQHLGVGTVRRSFMGRKERGGTPGQ
ncbi:hypothetical protein LTR28_010734 [Elasticomyces elasticus]|nr:hypothetical protein LTR28_010734 [Elasticomyces elasticus]